MKIGIDGRVLERNITGVGRYLINILNEIPNYSHEHEFYVITNRKQNHITDSLYKFVAVNFPLINLKIFTPFWLNKVLPNILDEYKIDLIIGPNILVPWTKKCKAKKISIVHDIMPITHPQFFPREYVYFLKFYLPKSIKHSDKIMTISEASKKSIQKIFNLPSEKITVVYNTSAKNFRQLNSEEKQLLKAKTNLDLPEKFLLYVGVLEKRKNIRLLIKVSDELFNRGYDIKIVLAGKAGFGFDEFKNDLLKRKERLIWLTQVDDSTLLYLYNSALCLIFPSYVEGFGLPPLEAMSCGLPVVASNCEALLELVGDAGFLCEPDDVECFVNGIEKLINDESFYINLKLNSIKRAGYFSSNLAVEKFLEVVNSFY